MRKSDWDIVRQKIRQKYGHVSDGDMKKTIDHVRSAIDERPGDPADDPIDRAVRIAAEVLVTTRNDDDPENPVA
jgi:hypothetical protein